MTQPDGIPGVLFCPLCREPVPVLVDGRSVPAVHACPACAVTFRISSRAVLEAITGHCDPDKARAELARKAEYWRERAAGKLNAETEAL